MSVNFFIRTLSEYSKGLLKTEMRWSPHWTALGMIQEAGGQVGEPLSSDPAGGTLREEATGKTAAMKPLHFFSLIWTDEAVGPCSSFAYWLRIAAGESICWCIHHGQNTQHPRSTGADPQLPISLTALPEMTCLLSQTYDIFLCFHAVARVLSAPYLLIYLNLAPNPDSKTTSSMLYSLICCARLNTPCCRPSNLQTLSLAHSFGTSLTLPPRGLLLLN